MEINLAKSLGESAGMSIWESDETTTKVDSDTNYAVNAMNMMLVGCLADQCGYTWYTGACADVDNASTSAITQTFLQLKIADGATNFNNLHCQKSGSNAETGKATASQTNEIIDQTGTASAVWGKFSTVAGIDVNAKWTASSSDAWRQLTCSTPISWEKKDASPIVKIGQEVSYTAGVMQWAGSKATSAAIKSKKQDNLFTYTLSDAAVAIAVSAVAVSSAVSTLSF
jgi:hypothetical protein